MAAIARLMNPADSKLAREAPGGFSVKEGDRVLDGGRRQFVAVLDSGHEGSVFEWKKQKDPITGLPLVWEYRLKECAPPPAGPPGGPPLPLASEDAKEYDDCAPADDAADERDWADDDAVLFDMEGGPQDE